jgi:hypothetical protein
VYNASALGATNHLSVDARLRLLRLLLLRCSRVQSCYRADFSTGASPLVESLKIVLLHASAAWYLYDGVRARSGALRCLPSSSALRKLGCYPHLRTSEDVKTTCFEPRCQLDVHGILTALNKLICARRAGVRRLLFRLWQSSMGKSPVTILW